MFAYGDEQVVRIHHAEADSAAIEARSARLGELRPHHGRLSFALPHVCELRIIAGWFVTFEPRLHGQTLARALREIQGPGRDALLVSTLEASRALGRLPLTRRWFGHSKGKSRSQPRLSSARPGAAPSAAPDGPDFSYTFGW